MTKIYHWIIACCLLLPLGGCSNWLDVIPEDSVDEKDLFSTGEERAECVERRIPPDVSDFDVRAADELGIY